MFDKEILENLRKKLKFNDPGIFEKTIYAFNLAQDLVKFYPRMIFKGGTSLLLHKFPPFRFSIDIDILLSEKDKKSIDKNLSVLVQKSFSFKSVEEDIRKSNIPKSHYKFYYDSQFGRKKQYILLDIVFCEHPYHKIVEKQMKGHPLMLIDTDTAVKIPSPEGLFGDKMGAIAPKTIGLALNKQREMEFVKQIIDLGMLFDLSDNLTDIKKTFNSCAKQENKFRNANHSSDNILYDILDVAFKYSQSLLKGANNSYKEIECINRGFGKTSNHLVGRYTKSDLKLSFSKIAYICKVIQKEDKKTIIKTIDYTKITDMRITGKFEILEGLKKTNPQAYFYWVLGYGEKK